MDTRFPAGLGTQALTGPASKAAASAPAGTGGEGFAGALGNALQTVSRLQNETATLQQQFQLGIEGASLEKTMIAMQKSQVAFQAALTVRNRLVSAYTDIMNMPV